MNDESKPDGGILGMARRLADQVGEYAKSDDAREKLDVVKKTAAQASGMATAGARKVADGTKQAAAQARVKAEEFSKSEQVEAIKAKAREDWDEIRGGSFRGSRLSDSPVVVGLAILVFFPLGLYLLWKHPVLRHKKAWWWAGGVWSLLMLLMVANGEKDKKPDAGGPTIAATGHGTADTSAERRPEVIKASGRNEAKENGRVEDERIKADQYEVVHAGTPFIVSEADSISDIARQVAEVHGLGQVDEFCTRFAEGVHEDLRRIAELDRQYREYSVAQLEAKYNSTEPLIVRQANEIVANRARCLAQGSFDLADRLQQRKDQLLQEMKDFRSLISTRKRRG